MSTIPLGEFFIVAIAHLLAVASPGPDFALIVRQSISFGRRCGVFTALGIGTGILVHVAYSLLGIGLMLARSQAAFAVAKLLGAGYLIFLGVNALRARAATAPASASRASAAAPSAASAYVAGFLTNVLNPKATLFFLSLFAVVVSASTGVFARLLYGLWMALATAAWFASLAAVLSHRTVRDWFGRAGPWFERVMGVVLIALALRLLASSARLLD